MSHLIYLLSTDLLSFTLSVSTDGGHNLGTSRNEFEMVALIAFFVTGSQKQKNE